MSTGTTQSQLLTGAGSSTFNVPAGVSLVIVMMAGAGAGGSGKLADASTGAPGGGAGEYCIDVPYSVTPGGTVSYTIGTKGAGGINNGAAGAGTATSFGTLNCRGGIAGTTTIGGKGGGNEIANTGGISVPATYVGGGFSTGANGGNVIVAGGGAAGFYGGPAGAVAGNTGGGGGAASIFGSGGAGGANGVNGGDAAATSYGAGGGGSGADTGGGKNGGAGQDGAILVSWVAG